MEQAPDVGTKVVLALSKSSPKIDKADFTYSKVPQKLSNINQPTFVK